MLTFDTDNEASRKTFLKNDGVLEDEIEDTVGLSKSGRIQRHWITAEGPEEKMKKPLDSHTVAGITLDASSKTDQHQEVPSC